MIEVDVNQNYYEDLGAAKNADAGTIQKKFRQLGKVPRLLVNRACI